MNDIEKILEGTNESIQDKFLRDEQKLYKVDYHGQMNQFSGAKENYVAGTEVEISYSLIATDIDYNFIVDGQEVRVEWNDKKGYIIRFTMPAHDIEVYYVEKNIKEEYSNV